MSHNSLKRVIHRRTISVKNVTGYRLDMEFSKEYIAFISYQRKDEEWAERLRNKLEHYRLPSSVRKQDASLPKEIRPIFHDTLELAGGILAKEIERALQSSKFLIVICSPHSAQSPWVNKEIQTFIDMGLEDRIIPFIIDGTPFSNDCDTECFPSALRSLNGEKELLGIDINEMGRDAAVVKVVARMYGLKFDTLWQRYEKEKRKKKNWIITAALTAFLCISSVAFWMYWQNQKVQKANWKMMENQSRFLTEKSNQLVDDGESHLAQLLALEALPKDLNHPQRPYVFEAEVALRRASMHRSTIIRGHSAKVQSACLSPDGNQIISASDDKTIRIWDVHTGECLDSLVGHKSEVLFANYNSDGNRVVSTSADGTVRIWETQTKRCIVLHGHQAPVYYASFSPDGKKVASISKDMTIKLWDANLGNCIHTLKGDRYQIVRTLNFTKDSRCLVSVCQEDMIITWNLETGECINKCMMTTGTQYFHYEEKERFNDYVDYLSAISPDGKMIAVIKNDEMSYSFNTFLKVHNKPSLGVYDIQTGKSIDKIMREYRYWRNENDMGYIRSVSFGPPDELLVVTTKDRICGFHIQTGLCKFDTKKSGTTIRGTEAIENSLTVVPNGNNIDVTEMRIAPKIVSKEILPDGLFYRTTKPLLSPNGKYIAYHRPAEVDSSYIIIWDVQNNIYRKIKEEGNCFCFSFDSKFIAWSDNSDILIQNTQTETINKRIAGTWGRINSVCFSTDGKFIASSCDDHKIRIYDIETGKCKCILSGHSSDVLSSSFSSDNKFILSASKDSTARIWDVINNNCVQVFKEKNRLDGACFSRDNLLIATISKSGNYVNIRDVRNGNSVLTIEIPLYKFDDNTNVSFSRNNQYIAIGNEIWDLHEKKRINSFSEGFGTEEIIGFDPNNDYLITFRGREFHLWSFPPLQDLIDQTRERFKNRPLTPEERRKYYLE